VELEAFPLGLEFLENAAYRGCELKGAYASAKFLFMFAKRRGR